MKRCNLSKRSIRQNKLIAFTKDQPSETIHVYLEENECCCGSHKGLLLIFVSARVLDFHTSCRSIWNQTSECSERVRFLILHQRVWNSRTKPFPCCNLFINFCTYWDFHIKFCCVKKCLGFYFDQSERRNDFLWVKKSFRLSDWSK